MRLAGWAGIVYSLLSLIVLPLAASPALPPPALGSSGAEIAAWYAAHRTGFLIGNYLGIAAFIPGFVQLAVLSARVRRLEGPDGWLAYFMLASGTFAHAVFACSLVVFQLMPFLTEPAEAAVFGWFSALWFALDGLAALPLVLSVGWATLRVGVLPRWFAHASGVVGAAMLLMSLGAFSAAPAWLAAGGPATLAGFVIFFLWTFAIAVTMARAR